MKPEEVQLVVVGSVGLDTVETPHERRAELLGGSVSYACAAASFFAPVGLVGVVGEDFPAAHEAVYRHFGVDMRGLQRRPGRTFRWSGVYAADMNTRRTLSTELNVFADFQPDLPEAYREAPFLFLANIAPELQLRVLAQARAPRFVAADTMDLWIATARPCLMQVLAAADLVTLNEFEVRLLTGEANLVRAARAVLGWGPRYVIIKKGEHGAMLFAAGSITVLPAYPLEAFRDPTGAGDSFAGGLMGVLAAEGCVTPDAVKRAMAYGTVVASFVVEDFSLERLKTLNRDEIEDRLAGFRAVMAL